MSRELVVIVSIAAVLACGCGTAPAPACTRDCGATSTSPSTGDAGTGSASSSGNSGSGSTGTGSSSGSSSSTGSSGASGSTGAAMPPAGPIGVNIPDLLWSYLGTSPDTVADAQHAMDTARARGITFARFIATPYSAQGMTTGKGWLADPAAYWAAFDALVADARARGLHLVPSLLWNDVLFPDVNGEPAGMLLTPGSASRSMAERYITEVVTRYRGDPAVLFWEMGNELNLSADIDVSGQPGGPTGTRTAADDIYTCNACRGVSSSQQDLIGFTASMAALFHQLDPARAFSTGFSYPRPAAYHLAYQPCPACDWTPDSLDEYRQVLAWYAPAGVDLVSVHHYPGPDVERFGNTDPAGLELLATTEALVQAMGKALYVGEYGQAGGGESVCGGSTENCAAEPESDPNRLDTTRILDGLVADGVAWSSLWAWNFNQFCAGVPTCASVNDTDPMATELQRHAEAAGACAGIPDGTGCPTGACSGGACTPVAGPRYDFSQAGSDAGWISWTNCSACSPGTLTLAAGHLRLTSNDLACTGSCQYPGAYALSPKAPASAGHAVAVFTGHATGTAQLRLLVYDSGGAEIGTAATAIPTGADATAGVRLALPAGAANVAVRVELHQANAEVDLGALRLEFD